MRGKVAVITGASRGIGAATARLLAEAGVNLGLGSRSGDDLGLEGALARPCDVRDPAALQALVDATVERFGRLDILVANAGVGSYHPFAETPPEHIEEMLDVNLKGTIYAVRAALPHLIVSGAADIVAVASEAGRRAAPNQAVYCATTSCERRACAARASAPAASQRTSRSATATGATPRRRTG